MPISAAAAYKAYWEQRNQWEATPEGKQEMRRQAEEWHARLTAKYGEGYWEKIFARYPRQAKEG